MTSGDWLVSTEGHQTNENYSHVVVVFFCCYDERNWRVCTLGHCGQADGVQGKLDMGVLIHDASFGHCKLAS